MRAEEADRKFREIDSGFIKELVVVLALTTLACVPLHIYGHEYIHYLQAGCHIENDGRGFLDRMGWGWEEEAPESAVAYVEITDCATVSRPNEVEPLLFNSILALSTSWVVGSLVFKKYSRKIEKYNDLVEIKFEAGHL